MPRSVYVVKGEGVRDSIWTPKASLSNLPGLPQSKSELVQTVPSPNCSVNPIVHLFVQAPSNGFDGHSQLSEQAHRNVAPNNAVVTPSVIPLRTPTAQSSPQPQGLRIWRSRGSGALGSFKATAGPSQGGTLPMSSMIHSSQASPSRNATLPLETQYRSSGKTSSNDSFRTYNGSPMIAAVLVKSPTSEHVQGVSKVLGSTTPQIQSNVHSIQSSALEAPSKSGIGLQTTPPFAGGMKSVSARTQVLRGSSEPAGNRSLSVPAGLSKTLGSGSVPVSGNKSSPSASAKANQSRFASRSGPVDMAVNREQKKAMQDIVDRRSAQRRATRSDTPPLRQLTPLSKLVEKSSAKRPAISENENARDAKVSNNLSASSPDAVVPGHMTKSMSSQNPVSPRDNNVTTANKAIHHSVPSSQLHEERLNAEHEQTPLRKSSNVVSQIETNKQVISTTKSLPNLPSKGQTPAKATSDDVDLHARALKTGALQSVAKDHRSVGEHRFLEGDVKQDRLSNPSRGTEQPAQSSAVAGIPSSDAPYPSSQSLGIGKPLHRDLKQSDNAGVAENQYSILIDNIFTLSSQIMGLQLQESASRTEKEGISIWKRRALEAIVSHGNRATSLNKKRLHPGDSTYSRNRVQPYALQPASSEFPKSPAVHFPRRSTRFQVQQRDIRRFKDMFQSWEECRGEGPVEQLQADALHLKCVTEALREGKRVHLKDEEVLPMFREFIIAKTGIEVITEKISRYSTGRHNTDTFPSITSWLRTTEAILSWFAYLGHRIEVLLKVNDEPLASNLVAFCAEFTRRLLSSSTQVNAEKGDGLKIAGSLRALKKVVAALPASDEIPSSTQKSQPSAKLTSFLSQYVQSFRRLSVTMARHAMPPSPDASRSETSRSETRSEYGEQRKTATSAGEDSSRVPEISAEGHGRAEARRKHDMREERAVVLGATKIAPEPRNSSQHKGTNQEDRLRRGAVNLEHGSSEVAKQKGSDRSTLIDRARGKNTRETHNTSLPSIPRKPSIVDNGRRITRAQSRPPQNSDISSKRFRTGPAATVHKMLADASSDTQVGSKKRKRGDGILQSFNGEVFGENGMRLNRPRMTSVRFGGESEGMKATLPDKETIKTLFSDGSDILGARNPLQEAAVGERARKLSRRSVSRCFGFLRSFVADLKSDLIGQPHVPSDVVSDPYPPSIIRNLARN